MPLSQRTATKLLSLWMSEISERCWSAGWLEGTEFTLWKAVLNGSLHWGQDDVTQEDIMILRELSEELGGWVIWDENRSSLEDTKFISLSEWQEMYKLIISSNNLWLT